MMRVLVGGVGYRHLRDHSFGIVLVEALETHRWPAEVAIEDVSYNPIAVVQRLQDEPAAARFDLAIVAGAVERPGRAPGTLSVYRWDNVLPGADAIQASVTEAVTGIIALDNTLVVARYFNALPPTVVVMEVEPAAHECGDVLTPAVEAALSRAIELVNQIVDDPAAASRIPEGALGVDRPRHTGLILAQVSDVDARVH